ncbi:glycosyltransferase involved in cell wall biosynthesis [Gillisia sp. Hel_I_86]|nr:glycosyltransferase involved in cell wall biosynthesis [Gillisia sp. Hel_I_86]
MVSMFSNHFFRWTEQLKDSGHEIYWLDVFDSNTRGEKIDFVQQIIGWRQKIKYPGRYAIKHQLPRLYDYINSFNQRQLSDVFEGKLKEIQPDVVHSFVMYSACVPILEIIKKHPEIKWIYSAWGNDLFFYQNNAQMLQDMKSVFPRMDYMFADCARDFIIAKRHGFDGEYLGNYPGGGGYVLDNYNKYIKEHIERNIILIKGYQHTFGRGNNILEAVSSLKKKLSTYEIVVFGTHQTIFDFVESSEKLSSMENLKLIGQVSHDEVLELMGKAVIYIGNSISDGTPNTLLEAIIMEVFPIQSNPGGATAEIIEHDKNGLLIDEPEDSDEIAALILKAIGNPELIMKGIAYNTANIRPRLERKYIQKQVLEKYKLVEDNLKR